MLFLGGPLPEAGFGEIGEVDEPRLNTEWFNRGSPLFAPMVCEDRVQQSGKPFICDTRLSAERRVAHQEHAAGDMIDA